MDNIFIEQLKKYGRMTAEAEQDLLGMVHKVHKKKGEQIVRQQQVATSFYIIEKGLVRSYNVINNKENTIWFAYEGQIAVSIAGLFEGKPSRETVECLEDCALFGIAVKDLQLLFERYNCMNTIGRKMMEEYCGILDDRAYMLQVMTATERYKDLLENEPEIVKRAPLSNIASFLGISQETLSRIRHNW